MYNNGACTTITLGPELAQLAHLFRQSLQALQKGKPAVQTRDLKPKSVTMNIERYFLAQFVYLMLTCMPMPAPANLTYAHARVSKPACAAVHVHVHPMRSVACPTIVSLRWTERKAEDSPLTYVQQKRRLAPQQFGLQQHPIVVAGRLCCSFRSHRSCDSMPGWSNPAKQCTQSNIIISYDGLPNVVQGASL